MPKTRVHELAKILNVGSKELIEKLKEFGIDVKSHMSTMEDDETKLITEYYEELKKDNKEEKDKMTEVKLEENINLENEISEEKNENLNIIQIPAKITVKDLADKLEQNSSEIVKNL